MKCLTVLATALGATASWVQAGVAQSSADPITGENYARPASRIADAVLAPRYENVTLGNASPDGTMFINLKGDGPPTMAMFAKPFYRIAGLQIDHGANRARRLSTRSGVAIEIINGATGNVLAVNTPDGARVTSPIWSPDGSRIAYLALFEDETHLYSADPTNGRSRRVTRTPLLATLVTDFGWTPDSRTIVTVLLPSNRGPAPTRPAVPTGPQVRVTTPETNSIRTYPDLLENPYEQDLLEYYATGQLTVVDVDRRRETSIGTPAMFTAVDISPAGTHVRISAMRRGEFSYIVPQRQFGAVEQVWGMDGTTMVTIVEREAREGTPDDDDADPEKRDVHWRPDGSLGYLQMERRAKDDDADEADEDERDDGGRPDRLMRWDAPFDDASMSTVFESNRRMSDVRYSADGTTLFITEQRGSRAHDYAVRLSDPDTRHTIFRGERRRGFRRSSGPTIMTRTLASGATVARTSADGAGVFLSGTDMPDDPMVEGPTAYIDRVEIESGDKTRVYESDNNGVFERLLAVLDEDVIELVVSRESPTDVPDSYLRNAATGALRQVTNNTDFTPDITNAQRRRYNITRPDGFEIAVNVTLPRRWSGEPLPAMFWFYPREYTDQDSYDETRERYNKNAFPNVGARSMEILVHAGYAVVQPDAPIVGDEGRMNDNYVHDLRNNLSTVIDYLDREGLIDRNRLGIGGHSYGAFGTVNAMVHTPFFKAGIAGDGNYNRTLTPFSFQSERRSLWQSRQTYLEMSPIFQADHITGALLMYHGEHDQNVGTFPINSWRLFESLEALGKTSSLYVYPYEDHGPATEETLLDLWARWTAWLDRYVKNAGTATKVADVSSEGR